MIFLWGKYIFLLDVFMLLRLEAALNGFRSIFHVYSIKFGVIIPKITVLFSP